MTTPVLSRIGRMASLPVVQSVLEGAHRAFLALRRLWRAPDARADEIARFNRLAATWWDPLGPMRPLHVVNALRLELLLDLFAQHLRGPAQSSAPLRVADIGCGAGLVCEPLAERGARVVGIDAAGKNIEAARLHAARAGLSIDYRAGEPCTALAPEERFDAILLLEVLEHVEDVAALVAQAARHLAPGGLLVASTINRTPQSFLAAIVGAEYVFRVLPVGTHRYRQLVRPAELRAAAESCGLEWLEQRGMRYLPVVHRAWWTRDVSINYLAVFRRPGAPC
jgi:2-polyprenyl-6-hydroxyphenyl methylase/3-demethylubiquinone-9 3-methyltransferase